MNVLIVDDDAYVLQGLKHGLDWGSLDINNVFTAPNVKKSKQIIESQSVQILICDIEMPKENGFDLLEWLKLKNIEMNVIMLTSHAEFKYAAQAIKYNCEAYSLKPIDFSELSELVSNAVSNAKKRLSLNDHEIFQEYWHKSENKRKEEFITAYLNNPDSIVIDEKSEAWLKTRMLPVIFKFMKLSLDEFNNDQQASAMSSQIKEICEIDHISIDTIISLPLNGKLAILVLCQADSSRTYMENDEKTAAFANEIKTRIRSSSGSVLNINDVQILNCAVVIGKWNRIEEFQKFFKEFVYYADNKLIEAGEVDMPDSYDLLDANYTSPDFDLWERFLLDQQFETVAKEACDFIDHLHVIHKLSKNNLSNFLVNLRQMVTAVMKANSIYASNRSEMLFKDDFLAWATQSVSCAKEAIAILIKSISASYEKSDLSAVEIVKRYINEKLDEDLTREKLAEIVFLNPDYLARVFKKETNESLSNYISRRRIEIAQEYLLRTNETINVIAGLVGFDNVSYFSKVFKERTGMTPKEYRRIN